MATSQGRSAAGRRIAEPDGMVVRESMSHFTPVSSLAGGMLIGLAAALLWRANGRIAGISGITAGAWSAPAWERGWRACFLLGLIAAPVALAASFGPPAMAIDAPVARLIVGGFLVGFGTRLGGGCTSGHGVCGIARLSKRSIVATCVFMAAGAVTVFLIRHVAGGV